jgi:hypothetical protein
VNEAMPSFVEQAFIRPSLGAGPPADTLKIIGNAWSPMDERLKLDAGSEDASYRTLEQIDAFQAKIDGLEIFSSLKANFSMKPILFGLMTSSRENQHVLEVRTLYVNRFASMAMKTGFFRETSARSARHWIISNRSPPKEATPHERRTS